MLTQHAPLLLPGSGCHPAEDLFLNCSFLPASLSLLPTSDRGVFGKSSSICSQASFDKGSQQLGTSEALGLRSTGLVGDMLQSAWSWMQKKPEPWTLSPTVQASHILTSKFPGFGIRSKSVFLGCALKWHPRCHQPATPLGSELVFCRPEMGAWQ